MHMGVSFMTWGNFWFWGNATATTPTLIHRSPSVSSNFKVWYQRTPQMYIVVESGPSRQDRDADGCIVSDWCRAPRNSLGVLTTVPVSDESIRFTSIFTPCALHASFKPG